MGEAHKMPPWSESRESAGCSSAPAASPGRVSLVRQDLGTEYFGRPDQAFMVNFRAADLDAMLAQLRAAQTGSRQVCDLAGNPRGGRADRRQQDRPQGAGARLPAAKTVDATSSAGAAVGYTATATDGADPHPAVQCTPASGATFKLGSTAVACTATDHVGNADHGSFTVTVRGAKSRSTA